MAEDTLGEQAGIPQTETTTRGSWGLTTLAPTCCPSVPVCAQSRLLPSPSGKQCQRGQEAKSRGQVLPAASRSQDLSPSELWPHSSAPFQEMLHWQTRTSPNFTPYPLLGPLQTTLRVCIRVVEGRGARGAQRCAHCAAVADDKTEAQGGRAAPPVPAPSSSDASQQQPRPGHSRCELTVGTVFLDGHF